MSDTEVRTVSDVGNQHGYLCPKCDKGDSLYIAAVVTAALLPDGCDTSNSDTEWDEVSTAWCGCGWSGTTGEFTVVEVEED